MTTRTEAETQIRADVAALHRGTSEHHNIPAICDELHTLTGDWTFNRVDATTFWKVVNRHRTTTFKTLHKDSTAALAKLVDDYGLLGIDCDTVLDAVRRQLEDLP